MDTTQIDGFFDEIEKIAQKLPPPDMKDKDNKITKDRFKRFLGAATKGAIGAGVGYGTGHYLGKPLQKKLVELGVRKGPAKVVRYLLPTAAGVGAALSLSKLNLRDKLFKQVKGEDSQRHTDPDKQSG